MDIKSSKGGHCRYAAALADFMRGRGGSMWASGFGGLLLRKSVYRHKVYRSLVRYVSLKKSHICLYIRIQLQEIAESQG